VKKAVSEGRCLFGTVDSWLLWVRKLLVIVGKRFIFSKIMFRDHGLK
jgi:hypothetical protein